LEFELMGGFSLRPIASRTFDCGEHAADGLGGSPACTG
jgi:hypothetical protein